MTNKVDFVSEDAVLLLLLLLLSEKGTVVETLFILILIVLFCYNKRAPGAGMTSLSFFYL